jgi:hypothetical protein
MPNFNKISSDFVDINNENYVPIITSSPIADQGWRLYNDSSAIPSTGTGGTTTGVTLAPDTTTLLGSAPNLRFTKDAIFWTFEALKVVLLLAAHVLTLRALLNASLS